MNTRKIVDYVFEDDATNTREELYAAIYDRVHAHIEAHKVAVAQNMLAPEIDEEVEELDEEFYNDLVEGNYDLEDLEQFMQTEEYEQLDELSKKTLGSYIKKASAHTFVHGDNKVKSADKAKRSQKQDNKDAAKEKSQMHMNTGVKRLRGISKATDKLTKEDVEDFMQTEEYEQLDELSKDTLINYINKRSQKNRKDGYEKAEVHSYIKGLTKTKGPYKADEFGRHFDKKERSKEHKQDHGVNTAIHKLLKKQDHETKNYYQQEDVEQIDEMNMMEGKRLVSTHAHEDGVHSAKVYYDPEYEEHQAHFYKDGKHMGEGPVSYHSGAPGGKKEDRADAQHHAKLGMDQMSASAGKGKKKTIREGKLDDLRDRKQVKKDFMDLDMTPNKKEPEFGKRTVQGKIYGSLKKEPRVKDMDEDVEQIDELSRKTLARYTKKSADDMALNRGAARAQNMNSMSADDSDSKEHHAYMANLHYDRAEKRRKGIALSTKKLAKEETQVDEDSALAATYSKQAEKEKRMKRIMASMKKKKAD